MAQYLKRWESPRREGRNDKGRGGSARQRQLRKQFKALKKKLQGDSPSTSSNPMGKTPQIAKNKKGGEMNLSSFFISFRGVE